MRRIIFYIALPLLLMGCKVVDDAVFDDISTARVTDYIEACDQVLSVPVSGYDGWKLVYYPDKSQYGAYTFLMRFDKATSGVTMRWDGSDEERVSTYSFNTSQGPVLSFDTYTLLHRLADPNPDVSNGKAGFGYNAEYEFVIKGVKEDNSEIYLKTKNGGVDVKLVRATAADWSDMPACVAMQESIRTDQLKYPSFYRYIDFGGESAMFFYSARLRVAYVAYKESDTKTVTKRLPYYVTTEGLHFEESVTFAGLTFDGFKFDAAGEPSLMNASSASYTLTAAASNAEKCRLHFWGSVESSREAVDGFTLMEHGTGMNTMINSATDTAGEVPRTLNEFRFYWNYMGYTSGEVYLNVPNGTARYIGFYIAHTSDVGGRIDIDSQVDYTAGDQVVFTIADAEGRTVNAGRTDNDTNGWFTTYYRYNMLQRGAMGQHFLYAANNVADANLGFTVIDFGGQMIMVRNGNNTAWAVYSPKEDLI